VADSKGTARAGDNADDTAEPTELASADLEPTDASDGLDSDEIETVDDLTDEVTDEVPAGDSAGSKKVSTVKSSAGASARPKPAGKREKRNPFTRLVVFIREVVAELRKVIWPTKKELITYTAVCVVFVSIVVALVALLDLAFAQGVLKVFSNGTSAK
jgi:preprotein translocase subunit SecE